MTHAVSAEGNSFCDDGAVELRDLVRGHILRLSRERCVKKENNIADVFVARINNHAR